MASFLKRVSHLGAATALGQVAVALNLVILARILPQAEVGGYSVFTSFAMILLPVSLLSYDVLLPNVKEEEVSPLVQAILPLAMLAALVTMLVASAFAYPHALTLSLMLLSMAALRLVEFASIRAQQVKHIALARTLPHIAFMAMLLVMALAGTPALSTVLWLQVAAYALPALTLGVVTLSGVLLQRPNWRASSGILLSHWRNPVLFSPSEIASTAAWNLPVVLVAKHFGEAMAAQYGIMLRYVMAPVGLINSVVGNVYHADLARSMRENDPAVRDRYRRLRNHMALIGAATGIGVLAVLPPVLGLLLGPGWEVAQKLSMIMTPLVAVAVAISPFGVSFYVFERSWELLILNLAYVAIVLLTFGLLTDNLWLAVGLFVALASFRFLVMLFRVENFMRSVGAKGNT